MSASPASGPKGPKGPKPLIQKLGHEKQNRQLLQMLFGNQKYDSPVEPTAVSSIRYSLRTYSECHRPFINRAPKGSMPRVGWGINMHSVFVASQMAAQDYTDLCSEPQALAIADFLTAFLPPRDLLSTFDLSFWYPTVISCRFPTHPRTFLVFAFLSIPMANRSYSIQELQEMRDLAAPTDQFLNGVLKNPDFTAMVKSKPAIAPNQSRRLRKPKQELASMSAETDEMASRGNIQPTQQAQAQVLDGGQELEWKYRGRSESEMSSTEPISAPAGLVAQQNEGFQRFFKAVSSPSHVRVTAGGRIVPNTRGSVSPTAKWGKDHAGMESHITTEAPKGERTEPAAQGIAQQFATMPPQVAQSMYAPHPAMFQHMGMHVPVYPMAQGFAMPYGFAPQMQTMNSSAMPTPNVPQPTQGQRSSEAVNNEGKAEGDYDKKAKPAQIRISPPEQFDQSRPYQYNGQMVYPAMGSGQPHMAHGPNPYFPYAMFGNSGFPAQRVQTMPQMSSGSGMAPASHAAPHGNAPPGLPPGLQLPPGVRPVVLPPRTSIRPSEITKHQIETLRASLKYYEDQIQYNKHQIDEKAMQEQVAKVKEHIARFEGILKLNLQNEALNYPDADQDFNRCSTPSQRSGAREKRTSESSLHGSARSSVKSQSFRGFPALHLPPEGRITSGPRDKSAVGINSNRNASNVTPALLDNLVGRLTLKKLYGDSDDPKVDLPSSAAMAAPFEPGYTPSVTPQVQDERAAGPGAGEGYQLELGAPALLAQKQRSSWETMQSANTYLTGGSTSSEARQFRTVNYGVPYLVGNLPTGTSSCGARQGEYVYSRELTDEEKRARHVYWGQIPNKGFGLPKFDGKDFYPASPVKRAESGILPPIQAGQVSTGRQAFDYKIQSRSSENDPFRTSRDADSIRSLEGSQRISKAIPIVAPNDATKTPKDFSGFAKRGKGGIGGLSKTLEGVNLASPGKPVMDPTTDKKTSSHSRRALERSSYSNKSGNDLLQTMLKKGSTSGQALPSAVSSTTATGLLPQYYGNAAASLGPAISSNNAIASPGRVAAGTGGKSTDFEGLLPGSLPAEKVGKNCPPSSTASAEYDVTRDLHERMLRDAERRGVIGSDWQ
ncbi:hypothetical protein F4780DRAFT_217273 [Xylariomycetidae sp. FL0641]|nr:hypothetical protein F4780DRAFT_217273 [Xylariomycetidae sp. FL0641]